MGKINFEENLVVLLKREPERGLPLLAERYRAGLFGLYQSFKQQRKKQEARGVWRRFQAAWQYADVQLRAYRIMN